MLCCPAQDDWNGNHLKTPAAAGKPALRLAARTPLRSLTGIGIFCHLRSRPVQVRHGVMGCIEFHSSPA
jgi:hypothetical protein